MCLRSRPPARRCFANYGPDEGFVGIECVRNAILTEDNGDIWFGTVAGAYRYRPDLDVSNPVEPLTRITNVRVFSENVDETEPGAAGQPLPRSRPEHVDVRLRGHQSHRAARRSLSLHAGRMGRRVVAASGATKRHLQEDSAGRVHVQG